ncbi:NUDIX hydrolase [Nocardioides sp.]|uniref:NUDIX hydrolase n=1 Tax=Nocardioides sp. TaxID=35761 RepID=UPI003D0CD59F
MSTAPSLPDVRAAGAVVTRTGGQVLLVHRPRYDDWSFPKGKLDRGEHVTAAGVREVAEETGLDIRLGPPLRAQRYAAGNRMKTVNYWMGRVIGDDDVSRYAANAEIDEVAWVPFDDAMSLLSYPYDRETLRESTLVRKKTRAFVVLRHAQARARRTWRKDDRLRPLLKAGTLQAQRAVPVLAAYDVTRLDTSSSLRCQQTLAPYADVTGLRLRSHDGLSEEDASASSVLRIVDKLVDLNEGVVVCTHRPVLPSVFDALGMAEVRLEPGAMVVAHLRKGKVVATERHGC